VIPGKRRAVSGLADTIRLRTPDCRQAAGWLPAVAAGETGVDDACRQHVATCLRCQAEVAFYRGMLRRLRALRHDEVPSPPGALGAVLAALDAAAGDGPSGGANRVLRVAYVGGITVATAAAGAAGVLVWMNRRRLALADTA
jgi:hypothetical protein